MGWGGGHHKRGSNYSYLDCYTPKLLWRPRRGGWQVPRMGESTGNFWYFTLFHPAPYSNYVYWVILILNHIDFGGTVYKRGSNFSHIYCYTPNYYGDLGEVCDRYPRWVKVPGPFDIWPFFTQFPILFTYIDIYRFCGSRYKRWSNYSYLDCYTPKLFWQPWWGMWKEPRMGESTGTFLYLPLFHPAPYSIYTYWDILVGGGVIKRRSNFSYLDCYTPKLLWRPSWGVWQVPRMGKVSGYFYICHFFIQFPIPYTHIETYGFWGARHKRGSNFSYLDCCTPKLCWRPSWGVWQVPSMGESTGTFWYFSTTFSSSSLL